MEEQLTAISKGILTGNQATVCADIEKALAAGVEPEAILHEAMIPAMKETGRLFEEGEYFLPEMLIAARAMKAGLAILAPSLAASDVQPIGKVVIGTVEGDQHDIGKNLVGMMMSGTGFEVVDLGADVKADRFVEAVRAGGVDIVCMSALLTTTMVNMKKTIEALKTAGLRSGVKILVGGAPLTSTYAKEIGADGFAEDASRAARLAGSLVQA